ncbi:hypothetical protein N7532_003766 [Penicillium argentinense]|uniref:Uncharacterized protein n=1 Tax=Penicillium argentinense TaxID=1131581 RepID=A0A9W9FNL1_9EURO|nr:uncharacterized protein N7532_003766 [Penicillium argentinense]KAJ5103237.1 hypothetical protein N7532_003766 [Penicillium argentinense]
MEPSAEPSNSTNVPQAPESSPPRLSIDFGWRKFKSLISNENTPNADPLYVVDYQIIKAGLKFKHYANGEIFGLGRMGVVSIDADYELHGRKDQIVAQSRLKTSYAHRSVAASTTDKPVTLTWYSDSNFTKWDFICCDEQQLPVAKLTMNLWGLKQIGRIEFMGPMAHSQELQEEIVVTSLTLAYQMALRISNLLNLAGALFARPGHEPKVSSAAPKTAPFSHSRTSSEVGQPATEAAALPETGKQRPSAI